MGQPVQGSDNIETCVKYKETKWIRVRGQCR